MSPASKRLGAAIACALTLTALANTTVTLRRGEAPPRGEPIAVNEHGIAYADPFLGLNATPELVTWDRVARIEGDLAQDALPFADIAQQAWRAKARLDRGDPISAEPLFERLLAEYRAKPGPLRHLIAEGLTRCRLARGSQAAAVGPWLIWMQELETERRPGPRSLADPDLGLLPQLPPVFLPSAAIRSMPLPESDATPTPSDALAWWYAEAIRFEGKRPSQGPPPDVDPRAAHVAFVADIVLARIGDAEQRRGARNELEARLTGRAPSDATIPWARAWTLVAIGRSKIMETDEETVRDGVLDLLTASSAYAGETPELVPIALAEAAVAMRRIDMSREATTLRREIRRRFPGDQALLWSELNDWPDDNDATDPDAPTSIPDPTETLADDANA